MTFQSVVSPDDLIVNLHWEGRRHDCVLCFMNQLQWLAWFNNQSLFLYRDHAKPICVHLQVPQYQKKCNLKVRPIIEWLFGEMKTHKYFDFKSQQKICLSSVRNIYLACGVLENAKTCLYSKKAVHFFEINPITVIFCYCPEMKNHRTFNICGCMTNSKNSECRILYL